MAFPVIVRLLYLKLEPGVSEEEKELKSWFRTNILLAGSLFKIHALLAA